MRDLFRDRRRHRHVAAQHGELTVASVGLDFQARDYRLSADVGYQNHKLKQVRPSVTVAAGVAIPVAPESDSNWAQKWTHSDERDTFGTLRGEVDLAKDVVAWAAAGVRSGDESNLLSAPTVNNVDGSGFMTRFDNNRHDSVRTGEVGVRGKLRTGSVGHSISATVSGYWHEERNAYAFGDFGGFASNLYRPIDVAAPPANALIGAGRP